MFFAGQVFLLPPANRTGGDPKDRLHVLLHDHNDENAPAALAYCSTQPTEASFGAQRVLVDPHATAYRSAFSYPTYVYPSRIVSVDPSDLGEPEGRVMDEMPEVREKLRVALGIGTGTVLGNGPAARSCRGCVVRLDDATAEEAGTPFGVVVTEPSYSLEHRHQSIVPLVGAGEVIRAPLDVVVQDETCSWLKRVSADLAAATLLTDWVFTVFEPEQMTVRPGAACVDEATMRELDQALVLHFGI